MTASTYRCPPVKVTVSKKSQASRASAWERRKLAQVAVVRSGAGSIPACCRISQTVEAATLMPRTSSSPWMLLLCRTRYNQRYAEFRIMPSSRPEIVVCPVQDW
jgi:hypothetical protein